MLGYTYILIILTHVPTFYVDDSQERSKIKNDSESQTKTETRTCLEQEEKRQRFSNS